MKWAAVALAVSVLLGALWHGPMARAIVWGLFSVALWLAAQGLRRWGQAIPDGKGNWIGHADAPAAFRKRHSRTLWGLYASSTVSAAIAVLPLLSD